jgi:hypothetical protein
MAPGRALPAEKPWAIRAHNSAMISSTARTPPSPLATAALSWAWSAGAPREGRLTGVSRARATATWTGRPSVWSVLKLEGA